jgi:hypothetical protein
VRLCVALCSFPLAAHCERRRLGQPEHWRKNSVVTEVTDETRAPEIELLDRLCALLASIPVVWVLFYAPAEEVPGYVHQADIPPQGRALGLDSGSIEPGEGARGGKHFVV